MFNFVPWGIDLILFWRLCWVASVFGALCDCSYPDWLAPYRKLLSHLGSVSLWRAGQRWSTTLSGSPWYYSIIVWGEIEFFSQPNPNKNSIIFTIKSKVTKTLKMLPWGDRVTVYLVERDMPSQSHEGTGEEYRCIIRSHTLNLGNKEGMPQTTNLVVF